MSVRPPDPCRRGASRRRFVAFLLAAGLAAVLSGCTSATPDGAASRTPDPSSTVTEVDGVRIEAGLPYRTVDGQPLRLDVCSAPAASSAAPVVVLIHGGSFNAGARDDADVRETCIATARAGLTTFSVDYRLVPDAVYPGALQDVGAAIDWIARPAQVTRFGIDPSRLVVFGYSAGAILAAQLAVGVPGSTIEVDRIAASVLVSGVYDFTDLPTRTSGGDLRRLATEYLGCASADDCPALTTAAPISSVRQRIGPVLLVHSANEFVPLAQAQRFMDALRQADTDAQLDVQPGDGHASAILQTSAEERDRVLAFLRTVTGG